MAFKGTNVVVRAIVAKTFSLLLRQQQLPLVLRVSHAVHLRHRFRIPSASEHKPRVWLQSATQQTLYACSTAWQRNVHTPPALTLGLCSWPFVAFCRFFDVINSSMTTGIWYLVMLFHLQALSFLTNCAPPFKTKLLSSSPH